MAYIHKNLKSVGQRIESSPNIYSYKTSDTSAVATASGYFDDQRIEMVVDDVLFLTSSTDYHIARILSVNPITLDLTTNDTIPAFKSVFKSYSFSQGQTNGTYYVAGFYATTATAKAFTQIATTQVIGEINNSRSGHVFIVSSGPGTATGGTGAVTITVTGTTVDTSTGVRTPAYIETIVTDITTMSLNDYYESSAHFIGQATIKLEVGSTGHTAYAATANYGIAKYDDFGDLDLEVTDFEITGIAGANVTAFNVELLHHKPTGWAYHATAFVPGNGVICSSLADYVTEINLVTGKPFSYKRVNLSTAVSGSGREGVIVRITSATNNGVQNSNIHIGALE